MKRFFAILTLATVTACSPHIPSPGEIEAHRATEAARAKCYQTMATQESAKAAVISSIPDGDREVVALVYLMQRNNIDLVAAATGHVVDPCSASNLFDEQIAEAREKNRAADKLTGRALGIVPWVVGGLTINALADKAGEEIVNSYSVSDNAKVNVNSQNQGNGNAVGGDFSLNGNNQPDNSTCVDCDSTDGTDEGEAGGEGGPDEGPDVELEKCLAEPPGGFNSQGLPLYRADPACSCHLHFAGQC